jgi:hypothetical protein
MSELNEQRWAVVSERGREAAGLTYAEAADLMRRLKGERIYGTCVITAEAAARLAGEAAPSANGSKKPTPAKKPRATRRKKACGKAVSD